MVEVWQVEEGLPQISVTSIAQTPDGYLWLGTFNGLARFDGIRFKVFDEGNTPALGSSGITWLEVDEEGALWIATERGGLARMSRGQFTAYGPENGLPPSGVAAFLRDTAKRLLLLDRQGTLRWIERGQVRPLSRDDRLAGDEPSLLVAHGGPAWIGQRARATRSFGQVYPVLIPSGSELIRTNVLIDSATASRSGGYWLATTSGVYRLQDGRLQSRVAPLPNGTNRLGMILEDGQGNCWAGAWRNDLVRWSGGEWQRFGVGTGLADNHLDVLFEDREGNLWVGTGQGGLHRFKTRLCRMYGATGGLPNAVTSLAEGRQGRIWIGINGGGLHYWDGGLMEPVTLPSALRQYALVYSVMADREDTVWIGLYGRSVLQVHGQTVTKHVLGEPEVNATPWVLFEDRAGALWLGTSGGLFRHRAGQFSRYTRQDGLCHDDVRALAEDRAGTFYIGTSGGGLNCLRASHFTCFTEREGLADNHIAAVYVDSEGTVWIGTANGGLNRFKEGRFAKVTVDDGLPSNTIGSIIQDDLGYLWLGSNRGLVRISLRALNEYLAGRRRPLPADIFTQSDGLGTIACTGSGQPSCCKARDGRLWFATAKGAAVVNPKLLPPNPLAPPVVIEEVALDDRHPVLANQLFTIPPGIHRVEFRYTGLSFVAPEKVRFRYRLEGFDTDWREAGLQRTAPYTRIPPGQYTFRVTACNNDGVWNQNGAALALTVLPPWWTTWWFRTLAVIGVVGCIFWGVESRVRRLKREHAAQRTLSRRLIETQEAERKRIAAELHDSLGQDLLVIKNRAVLGLQAAGAPQSAEQFDEISRVAARSLAEVRQISHDLRPYQLDRLGLSNALRAMVTSVAAASGIRCAAEVDSIDGLLPAAMEIHCYRIVQELLNNVVKHSHASAARVTARRLDRNIHLVLEDDGCGFDLEAARGRAAGAGLTDIAERVRILEGTLRCDSQRAKGTRWTIVIPLAKVLIP